MLRRKSSSQSGQVLVIFAFAFIAIIMMLALLFDGARALVLRRQMQDASDAAALAGANVIQGLNPPQCSATAGGVPDTAVSNAAKASVAANLPNYPQANVVVTCVDDPSMLNQGVKVRLDQSSPTFFGSIFGGGPLSVATDSSAVNGNDIKGQFSVVLLDPYLDPYTLAPYNATWGKGYNGCPSFLVNGAPTLTFESTIYVDSACSAADDGAFYVNGTSATMTFVSVPPNPPAALRIRGEWKPGPLTITPAPLEHQAYKPDPFLFITNEPPGPIPGGLTLKVRPHPKSYSSSTAVLLQPGVYKGGISVGATGTVYLAPGIYIMDSGGFSVIAGAKVLAVPAGIDPKTYDPATWTTSCQPSNCGVLIYNTGPSMGNISVSAKSTFKMRSYNPDADTTMLSNDTAYVPYPVYKNFLIWQSRTPAPSNTVHQVEVGLGGGGNVFMAGTVYAPNAKVLMAGDPGGTSGGDLTLQFVAWDLELSGNSNFYFHYDARQFPQLLDYGLIE
jgi:Flp pilus assembly protein TadG